MISLLLAAAFIAQAPVTQTHPAVTQTAAVQPAPVQPEAVQPESDVPQPPSHVMKIIVGRGDLIRFPSDVKQVAASEPRIADVVVISPREVMVNAKGPGRATVMVWDADPDPQRYDVDVLPDNMEFDDFRQHLMQQLPESNIQITGKGDTIVLTGTVTSSEQSKRAAGLAQSRTKNVINLLKAPPDPEPRQILLQVRFASIDRAALTQTGFNLFSLNPKFQGLTSTEQNTAPKFSQVQNGTTTNSANFSDLLNLFFYRPDLNIGATIKALQDNNILQILAEPNLICLEGKDASFLAGGSFPFPVLTTTSTGGSTSPVITVQFKRYGVQLDFTPTITSSGAVDLKIAPEVSSLDFTNAVTIAGYLIPALSEKRVDTEVILKEGESFAIAGMIDNQVQRETEKIIGLGDIPILGALFRSRQTNKTTNELLVVITPHIVKPLPPGEKVKLPDFPLPFQKTVEQEKKKSGGKDATPQPEFVGPRGHQTPDSKPIPNPNQ
jgi:pilus assembly protein CpaC